MKYLSLEFCQRPDVIELLKDLECEMGYGKDLIRSQDENGDLIIIEGKDLELTDLIIDQKKYYKTLNLEEAIELIGKAMCHQSMLYPNAGKWTIYQSDGDKSFESKTIIGAYEKFLIYLLDNNLIN